MNSVILTPQLVSFEFSGLECLACRWVYYLWSKELCLIESVFLISLTQVGLGFGVVVSLWNLQRVYVGRHD